jgi:hypothetical protein
VTLKRTCYETKTVPLVCLMGSRYSVVDIMAERVERSGVRIPTEAKRADQVVDPSDLLSGWYQGSLSRVNWSAAKLATCLRLVPRLGMSGAIPLAPLYTFMTCASADLTFQCV